MKSKNYEIIRTWANRVSFAEAEKLAKEKGLRIATNKEIDGILQDAKLRNKFKDAFPCWTSTLMDYEGEKCTVQEGKIRKEIKLPLNNGWYLQDEFGIPSGKATASENKGARYLWRYGKNKMPLVRGYDCNWNRNDRRFVDAFYGIDNAFGVVGVRDKSCKHAKKTW